MILPILFIVHRLAVSNTLELVIDNSICYMFLVSLVKVYVIFLHKATYDHHKLNFNYLKFKHELLHYFYILNITSKYHSNIYDNLFMK